MQAERIGSAEIAKAQDLHASDSLWPEGEEQRHTIDGRALVKRRRVLASGIEGEGAPEGDPTWLGLGLGLEPRRRPICTRATDHPSYPQSLCESQHPLQRRRGWVAGPRRIAEQVASIGILARK